MGGKPNDGKPWFIIYTNLQQWLNTSNRQDNYLTANKSIHGGNKKSGA